MATRKKEPAKKPVDMAARDLTLRYIDKDGKSSTITHRVWNASLFLRCRAEDARRAGTKVEVA